MPPSGGGKRKRGDRTYSEEDVTRPSPHRPSGLDLARRNHSPTASRNGSYGRGRGDRRGSRGGRNSFDVRTPTEQKPANDSTPIQPLPAPVSTPAPTFDAPPSRSTQVVAFKMAKQYQYVILTDAVREDWAVQGRDTVNREVADAIASRDHIRLLSLIQELIHAGCSGAVSAGATGLALRDALAQDLTTSQSPMVESALLDAVSVYFEDNQDLPVDSIVEFLQSTGVKEDVLRLELDQTLLAKLGLISGRFKQMSIRKTTNILYRQANFNLMREESEGFAKLITELFTTSGSELPTDNVIHQTVEKIRAMIGAFDLDVGRSLDVVLDVFGSVLVRHFRFLVKLLRASPWWPVSEQDGTTPTTTRGLPAWAEPNGVHKQNLHNEEEQAPCDRDSMFWTQAQTMGLSAFQQFGRQPATAQMMEKASTAPKDDLRSQWIRATGTIPPAGNRDAAQLLGFKLRFYSSSAARDPNEVLPDNLIHLSALLIKIGFISLNDLYPHIWRSDDEMAELKERKINEKAERERAARPGAGSKNALAMAGALADDTLPITATRLKDVSTRASTPSREPEASKAAPKESTLEPNDQKVTLLKSLLAVGALPEAFFILGRFPWIVDLYPEVPEYINRIMHHCLTEVYERVRPLRQRESLQAHKPLPDGDAAGASKGQMRLSHVAHKKTLKWANLDRDDSADGTDYRFYWDDWNDSIPICRNVDDVFVVTKTILPLVGVKIGYEPSLILKFTRIGKHSLAEDTSASNKARWLELIKRALLPSLSLTKSNAGVVNEVFELLSQYPITTRYIMYLEWSSGRTSRLPDIKAAFDQVRAETKDVLKRISKTNVKPMARALAKIAYANPHIVITTALTQIEVYDSIAEVFVEGARYFTDLGYDVLTWAMISSMGKTGRSRTQDDGIFASRWLSALSQFAGKIYKRYSMMKPGPILQYVADQLSRGNATDLKMLEQVISSMAGIATDTSFNDAQLLAMGGGPLLQSQTILQLLDKRNDSKTTSRRLLKSLHDHELTAKFLILMAQQQQSCVFDESDVPLKAIGNTYDEMTRVMTQYLDLLRSNLTSEEFEAAIPDITDLIIEYGVTPEIAFTIARPVISKKITDNDKESDNSRAGLGKLIGEESMEVTEEEEDGEAVEMEEIQVSAASPAEHEVNGSLDSDRDEAKEVSEDWHPVLRPVMDVLESHLPVEVTTLIGVGFFVTFWQLSLYDIYVPSKAYEDEMSRQKKKISTVMTDRSNVSASGAKARALHVKQYQNIVDELLKENRQHLKAYTESRSRLTREKDQWFANRQRQSEQMNTALMEYCFMPRILSSPQDAFFCFKFLKFLHFNSTPNFRTLGFYDIVFKPNRLVSLFFMCTSKESDHLGRFLRELLQDLARWHKDKSIYEREAYGSKKNLIGFAMKVENGKPQVFLDFEPFRRLLFKWHSNIHAALLKCLTSTEYMHARNAISVLKSIAGVFPAVKFHGTELAKAVDKLRTSDREDLKVAAGALLGALVRREKDWVLPTVFRQGQDVSRQESQNNTISTGTEQLGKQTENSEKAPDNAVVSVMSKPKAPEPRAPADDRPRPTTRPTQSETARNSPRPSDPALSHAPRHLTENNRLDRRHGKTLDHDRPHDHPRRLSPPRHVAPTNPPVRSEAETRNGYRDTTRTSTRNSAVDAGRPDSRSGYARPSHLDRNLEPAAELGRPPRSHERMQPPGEREDRGSRREHEARHPHEDRREREPRGERVDRLDRDHTRDLRNTDYNRSHESDRKRSDLMDDRRPANSSRSLSQPSVGGINPERAALIEISEQRPNMSIRGHAQDKQRSSRQSSPKRSEDDYPRSDRLDRNERQQRRPELGRIEPTTAPAFSGRDVRQHQPQSIDMQHGRLEPQSPQRPPRTERTVDKDVPSGPRQRGPPTPRGRGGLTPSSDRPAPTGPARTFRNTSVQEPSSTPKPPEATGVHPDRLNQISGTEGARFPPRQTQASPPSGPRNGNVAPPSSASIQPPRGPPTGPQGDGNGRGRRHPLETLNTTLAQAQGAPPSGRGRGMGKPGPMNPQTPPSGPAARSFGPPDPTNPNGMPVQPRPSSSMRDSKEMRSEDERTVRTWGEVKDDRESGRNIERRDDRPREVRSARGPNAGDLPPRKHPREDGPHYSGYARGNYRNASDSKRPRRGG